MEFEHSMCYEVCLGLYWLVSLLLFCLFVFLDLCCVMVDGCCFAYLGWFVFVLLWFGFTLLICGLFAIAYWVVAIPVYLLIYDICCAGELFFLGLIVGLRRLFCLTRVYFNLIVWAVEFVTLVSAWVLVGWVYVLWLGYCVNVDLVWFVKGLVAWCVLVDLVVRLTGCVCYCVCFIVVVF